MGPKKGKAVTVQRPGPDWSWVALEDIDDESEITQEHLRKAIGLETARPCQNKLVQEAIVIDLDETADEGQETDGQPSDQTASTSKKKNGKSGAAREVWGPPCTISWCQDNLLCLNHIAGKAWNAKNARETMVNSAGLGKPPLERKDFGAPVGLRNLGATCYIWYYNLALRAGVYAFAAAEGQDEDSPIFQLGLTFAALQTSETKYYDPSGLVNALRLDTGNQQDASEFSKLFMTHLQNEFSKQSNPLVKTLISDQFEGDLEYVTRCEKCALKSARTEKFLELEITLEVSHAYLENRWTALTSGPTAKRKINLTHLPPTLHFSLLRFVYDAKLGDRKKSKAKIEFPAMIDMSSWLNEEDRQRERDPVWYELRGVVEHRGASAHRGHFVCEVYDCENKQWYICNDETVEPISSLTEVSSSLGTSKPSSKNGAISRRNDAIFQTSTNAYMLVYERKVKHDPSHVRKTTSSGEIIVSAPTGRLAKKTAEMKRDYIVSCERYQLENLKLESIINKKLEIMGAWDAPSAGEGVFMHVPSLKEWIENDIFLPSNPARSSPQRPDSPQIEDATPTQKNESRTNGHHELENCHTTNSEALAEKSRPSRPILVTTEGPPSGDESYKYPEAMKITEVGNPLVTKFSNKGITCPHGKLCPHQTRNSKVISTEGLNMLKRLGCTVDIELRVKDICVLCVKEDVRRTKRRQGHVDMKKSFNRAMKEIADNDNGFLLPKLWLEAWRRGSVDESQQSGILSDWQTDITCPHGKAKAPRARQSADCTIIPPEAFGCLASLMDVSEIPHFNLACDVCQVCLEDEEHRAKASAGAVEMARDEKKKLKEMTQQSFLTTAKREIFAGIPTYLLSVAFVNSWLEWINDPIEIQRPNFSNRELFCQHHGLLVDPDWMPDHESGLFVVIYVTLWSQLVSLRSTSVIKLNVVEMISPADIQKHIQMNENESDDISESGSAKRKNNGLDTNFHPPKRQRTTRSRKQRSLELRIERHETVLVLKTKKTSIRALIKPQQVKEKWGVYPIFQHIFYGKTELTENTLLLKDVGVLADDTIYIVCDEMAGGMEAAMNDVDGDEDAEDTTDLRAGFGGTALFGLPATTESSNSMAERNADWSAPMEDPIMDTVEDVNLQCRHTASF
ncbi:hypothetical protein QFC21_000504 [Naganishia friedmannii]|uniref:Uncharacterized protein n=1 Tax=Naganishia friedmannii TaxID=89922 RepID=A0ACC2WCV0_9TREE|nr:hypothetical protein QFC21_000504 [Naganishia friedmannii]